MERQDSPTVQGCGNGQANPESEQGETITIRRTEAVCGLCEKYVETHHDRPYAVVSCEGACLRGEISRQAANVLCHRLAPDITVRICSGSALTKDSGQRSLVRNAANVLILEGCSVECASRSLQAVVPSMKPTIIHTDSMADFDRRLFGIDEVEEGKLKAIAHKVAERVFETYLR